MSKFDNIINRVSENIIPIINQQTANNPPKPATGTQPTPQQQKQALEQFAQAMGVDAIKLQKAIDTLKQQQKTTSNPQQQTNQPAV